MSTARERAQDRASAAYLLVKATQEELATVAAQEPAHSDTTVDKIGVAITRWHRALVLERTALKALERIRNNG